MLRRSRRPAALVAPLVILSGLLAACGSEDGGSGFETADRLDAVTIDGEPGEAPEVDWKERMTAGGVEAETLVEGDGAALADGDQVLVNFVVGDGYTRQLAVDSYGEEDAAAALTVGGEPPQPMTISDVVGGFLLDHVKAGVTRGSRLVITGDTTAIFGAELAQSPALAAENIGNDDGILIVADVLDVDPLAGPEGEQSPLPEWAPKIVFKGGAPSALDFEGLAKPKADDKLLAAVLKKGTGDEVAKGDLIVVDYLGQVNGGEKPFDESFTKDPLPTPIGLGSVVAGWDKKLVGQTVGSRVLLRIPPADGYADQEQPNIPKGSTLYFVVDILAAV